MAWEKFERGGGHECQKSIVFFSDGILMPGSSNAEIAFLLQGTIQQVQINAQVAGTKDTKMYIEKQSKSDYVAKNKNWQRLSDQLTLPVNEVYIEIPITGTVLPGDVFRLNFIDGDAMNVTTQIIIKVEG